MHSKIEHLSAQEQQLVLDAPIMVTVLIAGADGKFHQSEIKQAVKIIHTKSYSEEKDVRGIYKEIDSHTEEAIDELIQQLPESLTERTHELTTRLAALNHVLPKLEPHLAKDLYKSLREMAYYISHSHGATLGIDFHTEMAKELVQLKMIQEPNHS